MIVQLYRVARVVHARDLALEIVEIHVRYLVPCPALALAQERVHSHVERLVRQLVHQHAHLSVTRAVQLDVEWGLVFSILHHKSRQPNSTIFSLCSRVGLFS